MKPFRYDEHDGQFPEGGYFHPAGAMNRAQRRMAFRVMSTRQQRLLHRRLQQLTLYGQPWTPGGGR